MFLVCWHYCTSFLTFLLYAVGPIMIVIGAYVLKRGMVRHKKVLRQRALIVWLLAAVKMVFFDYRHVLQQWFCTDGICTKAPTMMIDISAFVVMGAVLVLWLKLYQKFVPDRQQHAPAPRDVKPLQQWTRYGAASVALFVIWVLMPFVTSLVSGSIPKLFLIVSWHYFAILSFGALVMAFWKLEEFQWYYTSTKSRIEDKADVWVPKDTLWVLALIYGVTAIMAFASSEMISDVIKTME